MKQSHFLHVDTNSRKLEVNPKFLDRHGQYWCVQSGHRILKLTVSQE